ncbi:MAG: response regulator [Opitutae bacterium]|nr:response regulator [Opitutae bacterium]
MQSRPPTAIADSPARAQAEIIRLAYDDLPVALVAIVVVSTGLAWVVARNHAPAHAWVWLACMLAMVAGRYFLVRRFRQTRHETGQVQVNERRFVIGAVLGGVGWGYAGWAFYPLMSGEHELSLLVLVLAGMTAGATRSLGPLPKACWSFQLLALLPLILRLLLAGGVVQTLIGVFVVLYLALLMPLVRSYHQNLSKSLRLGFEYAGLVTELSEENATRKKAETGLRAAMERAEEASRAKSTFLATMSHEIRTPMNGVLGMLDLLKTTGLTPAQREQVETASTSAESLLRMLNDILDFSKIEHGRLDFENVPFRAARVSEETVRLMRPMAVAKSLQLHFAADAAAMTRVMGDPMRLRQVLLNLIGNAIKFSEHGEITLQLSGKLLESPPRLELTVAVRDQGIGIAPDVQDRLFAPFMQGDSSMSRRYGGSGLGLAISQKLVQRMGGNITAESRPGQGSRFAFTVTFPLSKERNTAVPFPTDAAAARNLSGRVLVVEDDPVNQRVAALMLQRLGLQHHVVADGPSALSIIESSEWDLVLMDLQLPGIDGMETTRRARLLLGDRSLPIIALTANARAEERAACLMAGMDDFLAKPLRTEALQTCLARWLDAAR